MLESFVEKFQYVQDGISSSFRGLTLGEPLKPKEPLNFEAGCAILSKYQDAWEELHSFGEANAQLARDIDLEIGRIYHCFLHEKRNWETFQREFTNLEKMKTEAETVVNTLGDLRSMCSDIEEALIKLENLIEIQEYYKNEAQEKIKLSNYRVDKLMNLDAYRELLAEEHSAKVQEMEKAEMVVRQSKQDVYQAKFREDLEVYKRTGVIPQAETPRPSDPQKLEEVTIDGDVQDLEQYLQS
uniref:Dysbindin domain-containing protein 1 n=1 Tax=Panstrongylus megistus TaxID=65343 RepID=A0A069DXT2_9HEMI